MNSDEFARLKKQLDSALEDSLSKQDWAKALGISLASLHRYLDTKKRKEVPADLGNLMQALISVVQEARMKPGDLVEAIKATGVAGVVARAATAGLLPIRMVSLLVSTPALIWIGALGGAVGSIVGAGRLAFFRKVRPTPDKP